MILMNNPQSVSAWATTLVVRWLMCGMLINGALFSDDRESRAEEVRLTLDGRLKDSPTFVDRSGKEIAFVVQESPTLMRLVKLRLADGTIEPVTPELQKNEFEPAYSLDGQWLASVQSRGNLSMSVVIRQVPQGSQFEIPSLGGFCAYRSPAFSHDGQRVFYSLADDERQKIVSVDRSGKDPRTIVDGPGHANWPSPTPDSQRLVFASTRDGNYEIYISTSDGKNVRRLTDHPRQDVRPRVSPDGSRIAFTSARDGNYEVYVMAIDGSSMLRVTHNSERDDYAGWHPNSRQLVIVSERSGKHDLYLVDVDDPKKSKN